MVAVLSKMHAASPQEQLFSYFPTGGLKGSTLEDWYPGDPNPYIYAKSGTLGNVHCLSGYLLTKSGKTLIFSFMNNHFKQPTSEVKKQMQGIFEKIRDTY
jgi:D-alanyl-D-alanine carboxypeptidase/D-alanyl-D-alanine-endopeptidase (penicillin-binding protein 4)